MIFIFFLSIGVIVLFQFVLFFKPNGKKLTIMIKMITIIIMEVIMEYPLKQLISKKLKLLDMNTDNKLNFVHELLVKINQ